MPRQNHALEGTAGNAVTMSTGGVGDSTFDEVLTDGGTLTLSTTGVQQGSTCAALAHSGTTGAYMRWDEASPSNTGVVRFYWRRTNNLPASSVGLFTWGTTGTGKYANVCITSQGYIQVVDYLGGVAATSTGALAHSTNYRIESSFDNSRGTTDGRLVVRAYLGDSTSPVTDLSLDITGTNFGSNANGKVYFGRHFGTVNPGGTWYYDGLSWETATTTLLGPWEDSAPPAGLYVWNGSAETAAASVGVWNGTTEVSVTAVELTT